MVIRRSPVAIGSSVPQWPTFLIPSWRRTSATTSWDVMSSALSTSKMPSGDTANDVTDILQNFRFDLGESPFNPRAGGKHVSAAAELLANRADVYFVILGTHAEIGRASCRERV